MTSYPDARLYLAFASGAAVESVTRWVGAVAEAGGIRAVVVDPDESLARRISEAQVRQRTVNPPTV